METEFQFDWDSKDGLVLGNPRWPEAIQKTIARCEFPLDTSVVWVASSGTGGVLKFYGLSKSALLNSARAVNRHLQCTEKDFWINPLPLFHVGGLSVSVRSYVGNYKHINVWNPSWDARKFAEQVEHYGATIASLVPTQVYDLVTYKLSVPENLRAVVVGGGSLSEELFLRARERGWPLLPSYGMTECCSQVATAELGTLKETKWPKLKIMDHVEVRLTNDKIIELKSESLFSEVAFIKDIGLELVKREGEWHTTQDRGEVIDKYMQVSGRTDDLVKVSGELVSLDKQSSILESLLVDMNVAGKACLIDLASLRRENELALVIDGEALGLKDRIATAYNQAVTPVEKIHQIYIVPEIPKTELGKVKRQQLRELLA